jgi:SAM-dependent methyltransferase
MTMPATHETDREQTALWNGAAGHAWVDAQALLDRVFTPFEHLLVEAVAGSEAVLDVGCGAGGTTLAIARHLAPHGRALGIDISAPMIAAARARAEHEGVPAEFIRADAQVHGFEPAGVDAIVSRFGVMFFADPTAAFGNLRRAARPGASLRVIAWRAAGENPFMTTAERAAAPLLPNLPPRQPDAPGQFAFADAGRVGAILDGSGWTGVDIQPIDVACTLPETALVPYLTRLGPVGLALQGADADTRARVVDTVRPAFDPYVHGAEVRFTAACWLIDASA